MDDKNAMKTLTSIIFLFTIAVAGLAQKDGTGSIDARVNESLPTVYLNYVCSNQDAIRLRFNNNTIWHTSITTEKSYFPTSKPIILYNGNKGYAIPTGESVVMAYDVEADPLEEKRVKIPKIKHPYQMGGGRVTSTDYVFFDVPAKDLKKGLKISVEFSYEWEGTPSGNLSSEPMHRVYFRGGDIGSLNTDIVATPCAKRTQTR